MAVATRRPWSVAAVAAASMMTMLLLLLLPTPSSAQSLAAAPGPAGGIDSACMNSLLNMSDCLAYVTKGSNARRPDKPCCPELAGLVGSNPVCLCELLSGAADSYGIAVDYARALALPGICRVATPPVSTCTGSSAIYSSFNSSVVTCMSSALHSTRHRSCCCFGLPVW